MTRLVHICPLGSLHGCCPAEPNTRVAPCRQCAAAQCVRGEGRAGRAGCPRPSSPDRLRSGLLDLDARAGCLQLLPRLVCLLLRDLLEDRLRRTVDEVLGLLQPEARQRPHLLDHLDLLVAGSRQDHVELRLLLHLLAAGGGAGGGHHHRGRGRRLHIESLFERFDELRQLEEVHLLELVEELVRAQLRHRYSFPSSSDGSAAGASASGASASRASASGASASGASASRASPSGASGSGSGGSASGSVGSVPLYASSSDRNRDCAETNVAAARAISPLKRPALLESITSRLSRSASRFASSAESTWPSMYPPFSTRVGNCLVAALIFFAALTASPSTNATADGPDRSSVSSNPASAAARCISVFLTTVRLASASRSVRRNSVMSDTVKPRYSASSKAADPSIRRLSSATRSSFSVLGIAPPRR